MAAYLASQAEQDKEQVRKRRAKGGQGGKRGRGKGGKSRKPKDIKIPTEFRRFDKNDPMQARGSTEKKVKRVWKKTES